MITPGFREPVFVNDWLHQQHSLGLRLMTDSLIYGTRRVGWRDSEGVEKFNLDSRRCLRTFPQHDPSFFASPRMEKEKYAAHYDEGTFAQLSLFRSFPRVRSGDAKAFRIA